MIERHRHTRSTINIWLSVFPAARTCLRSRCLAMKGGIHIQTQRLMGGIYELHRWDGLRSYDIRTKFHKNWFRHSKVNKGGYTNTQTAWRSNGLAVEKASCKVVWLLSGSWLIGRVHLLPVTFCTLVNSPIHTTQTDCKRISGPQARRSRTKTWVQSIHNF
jgi:hypothetical protein